MREKESRETSSSSIASARCMTSSQVKQTLSKLEDGDTRRNALNSLKQWVEGMDSASIPRFIGQVSEAKESSRKHAISLYEDVARVHGKLMIAHIPRVMTTVTKTLSSSGSSPPLQLACAKVISAVAKHSIDEGSPAQAAEVLRDLCNPLLEVLTGKLEPLAAGAALCLQSLVESEKWKFAPSSVIEDLCLKTTVALAEKGTRTVAHMQLASSLAISNSAFLAGYAVSLLRSGVEVLKYSATSTSWQQRASAARLLTAVLPTMDRATLAEELSSTVQALDNCKHDRMSNVRWAVKEALTTAKEIISEENFRRSSDGDDLLSWMTATPEPSTSSLLRRSSLGGISSDDLMSPPGWKSSRSSKALLRNSSTSSGSPRSRVAPALDQLSHRPPLQATKLQSQMGTVDMSATSFLDLESPRKENLPSNDSDTKVGALAFDADLFPSKRAANEGAVDTNPLSAEVRAELSSEEHEDNFPSSAIGNRDAFGENFLAGAEDVSQTRNAPRSGPGRESEQLEMKNSIEVCIKDSPTNGVAFRSNHGVLNGSSMKHVFELKGPSLRSSPRTKDDESVASAVSPFTLKRNGDGNELTSGLLGSPLRVGSPVHLNSFEVPSSPQITKPLLAAEDFLAFSTPRRLVRSLQENFASPQPVSSSAIYADNDSARPPEEDDLGDRLGTDMDLGTPTSTSTAWSVRTNPIASDESLKTESDDSDHEQGRAAWKKMIILPSPSPTAPAPHTPPAQETDNPDIDDEFRLRLNDASSAADPFTEVNECSQPELALKNEGNPFQSVSGEMAEELKHEVSDEVETKRISLEGDAASNLEAGFVTRNHVDKWSCSEDESVRSEPENGVATASDITAESGKEGNEMATPASIDVVPVLMDDSTMLGEMTRRKLLWRGWRQRLKTAIFSWQWCVVFVAIPFAFALSKVVFPSDPHLTGYLVPT